jgi:RHS repeat-associated protein
VYNVRGQLTTVNMPRPTGTQTRTFSYDLVTGRLNSATNPENGTVNYVYNADGTVDYKIDAKGQKIDYLYDSYKRVTEVRRYSGTFPYNEVTCERTTFYYDTNTLDPNFTQNGWGRLVAAQWGGVSCTGGQWTEMYSYSVSGRVLKKRLSRGGAQSGVYLEGSWSWDTEGRMQSVTYPLNGPTYTYTFDSMGRPWKLTDNAAPPVEWAKNAVYDAGNRLTGLDYISSGTSYYHEERGYNTLGQLTSIEVPNVVHQVYTFSATQNNGRIVRMNDFVAQPQQEVNYVYDELNRLKEAKTTDSSQWGQSFTYDGFGNRTAETVIQGTAPSLTLAYDPATNRIVSDGYAYDLNGNLTKLPAHSMTTPDALQYDIENRLIKAIHNSNGTDEYRYDPANKRVWKKKPNGQEETYFYGVNGEKLGTYSGSSGFWMVHTNLYFAGKLIRAEGQVAVLDRLGSVANGKKYFPYGEEQGQTTAQDHTKFSTYFRDDTTALDYADQRYYSRSFGRFLTPDPYRSSAGPKDPGSWNRYPYVGGDPLNFVDPTGTVRVCVGPTDDQTCWDEPDPQQAGIGQAGEPTKPKPIFEDRKPIICKRPILQPEYLQIFDQMGDELQIDPAFIMALAVQESGWNLKHVYETNPSSGGKRLNNLFGLTNAGGDNLAFSSVQASADYWITNWGPYLSNHPSTIQAFVDALTSEPRHMYNIHRDWKTSIIGGTLSNGKKTIGTYQSVLNTLETCGLAFQ